MKLLEEVNISLEVILLLAIGLIMFVLGAVLFPVAAGSLPYYEDGVYGLLLIMFGLQLQTVGKTPLGFVKRSWRVLVPGIIITVIGFVTCFIPGILGSISKFLVIVLLGIGGILLLLQLFLAKDMYRFWKTLGGGVFTHLTLSCAAVYILEILIAVLLFVQVYQPGLLSTELIAIFTLLFGVALFYLAFILKKIYQLHPESDISTNSPGMSLGTVMGMQFGFFMMVTGCLLVPVSLGILPHAVSAQLGMMVVLLGVQALVAGTMMTFAFKRNRIFFLIGMVFIAVGAFAIIIPDTIVGILVIFIGSFNILGGLYLLYSLFGSLSKSEEPVQKPEGKDLKLMLLMLTLALLTAILMITFGASSLIENLIPGNIIGIILACFGLSQFLLLYVQSLVEKKQRIV
jgi:hypothetical protein